MALGISNKISLNSLTNGGRTITIKERKINVRNSITKRRDRPLGILKIFFT
tara:strand:- start:341 stop:493 length:153 start_codon:yes stop_codon:yes gene_type:complete